MQTIQVRDLQGGEWVDAHLKPRKVLSLNFEWAIRQGLWLETSELYVGPHYIKLSVLRGRSSCISKGWDVPSEYFDNTVESAIKWFRDHILSSAHVYSTSSQITVSTLLADNCVRDHFGTRLMIVSYKQSPDTLFVPNI